MPGVFPACHWLSIYIQHCIENKTNSSNSYPPTKGYFRETCKSQNIKPIYLNPISSPWVSFRSYQMPVKYVLVLSLIKRYICTISISDLSTKPQRSRVCVNSKCYLVCWSTLLSLKFDIQHDHFQIRKQN